MSTHSGIEWTESTWNPLTGCTKVSPGCKHCYAERMAKRLQAMGQPNYTNGFKLADARASTGKTTGMENPAGDLRQFDERPVPRKVPVEFIQKAFDVMRQADWHQFQVLTKRAERLARAQPAN